VGTYRITAGCCNHYGPPAGQPAVGRVPGPSGLRSTLARWYTSPVPTHRRLPRSRLSRIFVSTLLGVVTFVAIGSAVAGNPAVPGVGDGAAVAAAAATQAPAATPTGEAVVSAPRPNVAPSRRRADPASVVRPTPLDQLTGYRWPLEKGRLTLPFGPTKLGSRVVEGKLFHDGIDLATFCGDRIRAAHDGVVLAAGRHFDRQIGWVGDLRRYFQRLDEKHLWITLPIVVIIDDGNGYRSVYAHFEKVTVRPGQTVRAGQLLGYEGATGRATGCHVHYGLFSPLETATFAIDPAVVKRMKVPPAEIARVDPLLVLPPRPDPVMVVPTTSPLPVASPPTP
jgi:murein DD-endopeptidase MepM/ murein hydrolase activator NlpD